MLKRILLIAFVSLALIGCAKRHSIVALTQDLDGSLEVRRVLVATSRAPTTEPGLFFGRERSTALSYAEADVSVPSERAPGQVPHPTIPPQPRKQFAVASYDRLEGDAGFISRINRDLAQLPVADRNIFVFVHGYNVGYADGIYRTAQLAHDFRFPGMAVHYSWPSAASAPLYLYDRDSAAFARDGLTHLLSLVEQTNARSILLVGHSMGTYVVMEALRDAGRAGKSRLLNRLEAVVLAAPDIDQDLFFRQLSSITPRPDPFVIFVSGRDRALQISQRIRGGHARIGEGEKIDALRAEGITVIDLTDITDGGRTNHATFASSPTVIRMAESGALSTASLINHATGPDPLAEGVGQLSDIAARIVYLPANVVGAR